MNIRETAYAKWLNAQAPDIAAYFIYEDMRTGPKDSMAWDVMELAHGGKWRFEPKMMPAACEEAARILRMDDKDFEEMMKRREENEDEHCEATEPASD